MKPPSKNFLSMLEILDPLLSVRWGGVIQQWVIERKSVVPITEVGYLQRRRDRLHTMLQGMRADDRKYAKTLSTFQGVAEEFEAAKTGKRVVIYTPELTDKTYNALCAGDLRRYGGYSRYADELEAKELAEEKDRDRIAENERMATHKETHSMLNFIWRKKEDMLLNGERNMNKLLHGKKSNKPLIEIATH